MAEPSQRPGRDGIHGKPDTPLEKQSRMRTVSREGVSSRQGLREIPGTPSHQEKRPVEHVASTRTGVTTREVLPPKPQKELCLEVIDAFRKRHCAVRIQQWWRLAMRGVSEQLHRLRLNGLLRLNAAALHIQQWWRIHLAKQKAGVAALFRTSAVNRLKVDPQDVRTKKASQRLWDVQELAVRELTLPKARNQWEHSDFLTCVHQLIDPPWPPSSTVCFQRRLMPREEADRLRAILERQREKIREKNAYFARQNPERIEGRYEMRVTLPTVGRQKQVSGSISPQRASVKHRDRRRPGRSTLPPLGRGRGRGPRDMEAVPPRGQQRIVEQHIPARLLPQHLKKQGRVFAPRQWDDSPWPGEAPPWAEAPKATHQRRCHSHLL